MTVVVYTAGPACMACAMTRRHLDRRGIDYTEVAVDAPGAAEELASMNVTMAPVVRAGDDYWGGYRPDKIDALK